MLKQPKPVLTGPRVTLRDAGEGDIAARFALGNDPDIQHMFGAAKGEVREITEDAARAWVAAQADDPFAWVIEAEGRLMGAVRLHTVNHADKRANVAIGLLDKASLGKGYGTEALKILAAHAFDDLDLHRLTARVLAFNEPAIAAYQKVGFEIEGRERHSALIGDTWHDDVVLGLLETDLQRLA